MASAQGGDAARVVVGDVPVYTFGFSAGMDATYDPKLLNDIARKSYGGTFSVADTEDTVASNLSMVFSQCFARLVTIVVRDLMLKVRSLKSKIAGVIAGSYPQTSNDSADGSVTIALRNLSIEEMRNVTVNLVLPVAKEGAVDDILEFSFSYNSNDGPFDSGPRIVRVNRVTTTEEPEHMKVMVEQARLKTKNIITQAREMAEKNRHQDAKHMLNEAYGSLEDVFDDEADLKFEMLRCELKQLSTLMSPQMYKTHGRSFALSSETSHDQQRFAARGDVAQLRMFATPRMDAYLVEAKSFHIKHHS